MKKILELTDQRVKSLEKIAESVTDVINNVQNAKDETILHPETKN